MNCSNKMIIFGSGKIGGEALDFLGKENIWCFCDNNPRVAGTERYEKNVISFAELRERYHDAVVVIAAGESDSYCIAKQCEENGVPDYIAYQFVKNRFPELEREELCNYLANAANRADIRKAMYLAKAEKLQAQVDYFKSHADIRSMKPATGKMRRRQLDYVQAALEFFEKISSLEIRPILDAGNLLGYVRHNGFIPWDDDMDFALLREDYRKLKAFCQKHVYEQQEFFNRDKVNGQKRIADGMQDYYWCNMYHYFCVMRHYPDQPDIFIEFFSLDYYADSYSFEELRKLTREVKEKMNRFDSVAEKIEVVETALLENSHNTVQESNQIFFGLDNVLSMFDPYPKAQYIPKNVLLPLKRVRFEGGDFWIPNEPEEFLKYQFENIWEFPDDVGCPRHSEMDEKDEETESINNYAVSEQ